MLLEQKDTRPVRHHRVLAAKNGDEPGAVCTCTVTALPSPAGEVRLLAVAGEIDLCSLSRLQAALTGVLAHRPDHLVVDLAGVTFCSVCGITAVMEAAAVAAGQGTGFAVSGTSRRLDRVWALLWPEVERPMRFPTAGTAVLSALAHHPT